MKIKNWTKVMDTRTRMVWMRKDGVEMIADREYEGKRGWRVWAKTTDRKIKRQQRWIDEHSNRTVVGRSDTKTEARKVAVGVIKNHTDWVGDRVSVIYEVEK